MYFNVNLKHLTELINSTFVGVWTTWNWRAPFFLYVGRKCKSFSQFNCTAFTMNVRADRRICINAHAHSTAPVQGSFFLGGGAKHRNTQVCQCPYSPHLAPCDFCFFFPKAKITVEREICECDGHTVHKLSQRRLTADWLAPRESDCSRMNSKVSSHWLPWYIKAKRPVLEIFKMAGYFPERQLCNYAFLLQNKYIIKIWVAHKRWYFVNCFFTCPLMNVYLQSEDDGYLGRNM